MPRPRGVASGAPVSREADSERAPMTTTTMVAPPSWSVVSHPPGPRERMPQVSPQPSILAEYVFFPFYDWIVQFFPAWWVPNVVTLVGVSFTMTASLLALTSMPPGTRFETDRATLLPATLLVEDAAAIRVTPLHPTRVVPSVPSVFPSGSAMLVVCGVLNVLYCIADNTDGRLARRLKKSSAIGEYLDHGLDCVTSLLSTCVAMSAMGGSLVNIAVTLFFIAYVTVLSHTLNYEANVFIWGNRLATVDEAMVFFAAALWFPVAFPDTVTRALPPALLEALLPAEYAARLSPMKVVEVVYVVYSACQTQVIGSILARRVQMVCRVQSVFIVATAAVLLGLLPVHASYMEQQQAHGVAGYTLGPLTYPAIWFITAAFTCSTIVHTAIFAKCCQLPAMDYTPLTGPVFVWLLFASCPVGGMLLAVLWHIAQILTNLSAIRRRHVEGGTAAVVATPHM